MIAIQIGILGAIIWLISLVFFAKTNDSVFAIGSFASSWMSIISFCSYFIYKVAGNDGIEWWVWIIGMVFVPIAIIRAYTLIKIVSQK